jgi:hypothetical protein
LLLSKVGLLEPLGRNKYAAAACVEEAGVPSYSPSYGSGLTCICERATALLYASPLVPTSHTWRDFPLLYAFVASAEHVDMTLSLDKVPEDR